MGTGEPVGRSADKRTPIDLASVKRYLEAGLTTKEMVERFYAETGERRTMSAFAVFIHRNQLKLDTKNRARPRYDDLLPWRVKVEHSPHQDARMLRALARSRTEELPPAEKKRLEGWLRRMDRENLVIRYEPDTEQGFWRVPRREGETGYIRINS